MISDLGIWAAFAKSFGMLFLVLGLLLLAVWVISRFSKTKGLKAGRNLIRVLSVHHISPKEKLMLVHVPDKTLLIGVTPSRISSICELDDTSENLIEEMTRDSEKSPLFAGILSRSMNRSGLDAPGKKAKGTSHDA